jgi:hypothetical protein
MMREPGSSVSIVSDYGLDDRVIEVRSPAEAHPASGPMATGGPLPGYKARPRRDADRLPPSSVEVVNE